MKLSHRSRTRLHRPNGPGAQIVLDDEGLQVVDSASPAANLIARLAWADVTQAVAFKRDLFATDLVCLLFDLSDGRRIEVNEDAGGWDSLLETLPNALPGALDRDGILGAVVKPAFATNETVVYARNSRHAV